MIFSKQARQQRFACLRSMVFADTVFNNLVGVLGVVAAFHFYLVSTPDVAAAFHQRSILDAYLLLTTCLVNRRGCRISPALHDRCKLNCF